MHVLQNIKITRNIKESVKHFGVKENKNALSIDKLYFTQIVQMVLYSLWRNTSIADYLIYF